MGWIIGIDNGVSGSIGIISPEGEASFHRTPVKKELSYTKEEHHITRVDITKLREILQGLSKDTEVLLERPMINPRRFRASMSAMRSLEATVIVIEELGYFLRYVDSKEWQSILLPGVEGSDELKAASLKLGQKLYPNLKYKTDADSILIAHWAKYKGQSMRKKEL